MFGIETNVLLISSLSALSACVLVYAISFGVFNNQGNLDRRLKNLQNSGATAHSQGASNRDLERIKKRKSVQEKLKRLEEKQKKINKKPGLQDIILQAGLKITVTQFLTYSLINGVGFAALAFVVTGKNLVILAAFIIGLIFIPQFILRRIRKKRINRFITVFPDAIDVIIRGVQSGLPINDCFVIVGREASEPVSSEFRKIIEYQHLGQPLSEAVLRLTRNIPTAETNFFGIVISIQQTSGGNLAEALSNLSSILRDRKKMEAKIIAMSSEAKASGAIIGSLPFIVTGLISLIAPSYIAILFTEFAGNMILIASLIWMSLGIFVMKQMINFDF